jgi:hypothetical protein
MEYFGPASSHGEVDFSMVAMRDKFHVFVDGAYIATYYGRADDWLDGWIGYAVISGTNAGYGTRCEITNVELWEVEP